MKTTDTSENEFERLIVHSLVHEAGYIQGDPKDYDREHAIDLAQLFQFLADTQPETLQALGLDQGGSQVTPGRTQFLHRLQGEIAKRGVIDVLRSGIKHGPASIDLFYGTPTPGNVKAAERFAKNRFSVTRQLRYSRDGTGERRAGEYIGSPLQALDLALFINGLPIVTFELKNRLTKQTVFDAVQQYQRDRNPRELLFQFGRCMVHFAVDDQEVRFCTHLKGNHSWFLPFNQGHQDGAGNPPNPAGIATDYLWKKTLTKAGLTDILENYAQVVEEKDEQTSKKKRKQIFPRYHQLAVVRGLLADLLASGVGKRYLIQHSAGSGKSNSIAWLAHQLIGLQRPVGADLRIRPDHEQTHPVGADLCVRPNHEQIQEGQTQAGQTHRSAPTFDSVIVVTDRRILDKQIRDTIKQFAQVSATVGHAEHSGDLRRFLASGKQIIITTVQKFPVILDEIGNEHRKNRFAIIIDEAHSSQGGRTAAKMNMALAAGDQADPNEETTTEDRINQIMEGRKMLGNASYFAFTATPKNKTLELFGDPDPQPDGTVQYRPFHSYTMKQAIQEGFILDVLKHYTPVESYYRLAKTVEDDPLFDANKAAKKLRRYVESHQHAIREKAEIMVDHFHAQVIGHRKLGGQARAMVITNGIERAIQYFQAFKDCLKERKSLYQPIVAFSGEPEYGGKKVTEAGLNGFPSSQIPERIRQDPYRFLIVADKYQTGYDEPLLHTMYVDKPLSGIKAVQTLSRLNRAHPQKHDTCVLDFYNDSDTIQKAFEPYYRATILSDETDPDKLHDLKSDLDGYQVYAPEQIDELVERYLSDAERDTLDPILDTCVATYNADLDEDGQVDFKGKAKAFVRTYGFLASILPYSNAEWEKLSIFLNFLIPKLPAPKEEDLSRGILEAIDMDSYRAEVKSSLVIALADQDGVVDPVPASGGGSLPDAELEQLSNILKMFNDQFGNIDWKDRDRIEKVLTEEIPAKVSADTAYRNAMKNNDKKTARIEHDAALQRVMIGLLTDHTELFKQFSDNPSFKKWLGDTVFGVTYQAPERASVSAEQ